MEKPGTIINISGGNGQGNMNSNVTHGDTANGIEARLYCIWKNMKSRCLNPNRPRYHRYGGRGIIICDKWKNDYSVFKKWAMGHGYKPHLQIDRKNNDKGYYPRNCQWITKKENTIKALTGRVSTARKLTNKDIKQIRSSSLSQYKLAKIYGISGPGIWKTKNHKTYIKDCKNEL